MMISSNPRTQLRLSVTPTDGSPTSCVSRAARAGLAAVLVLVLAGAAALPAPAVGAGESEVRAAESELARAKARTHELEDRVGRLETELAGAESELDRSIAEGEDLGADLVATENEVVEYVVDAYIAGGELPTLSLAVNTEDFEDSSWRHEVLATAAEEGRRDMDRLVVLRERAGERQARSAESVADRGTELTTARNDLIQASAHQREAEDALEKAREDARREAVEAAAAEAARREQQRREAVVRAEAGGVPTAPMPTPGASGLAGDPTAQELAMLAKIRRCESRGNYSIVSASGKYRGAYQFDRRTWAGVGGNGDPAAAPPQEQDYRALMLYRSRGGRPWPNCSR